MFIKMIICRMVLLKTLVFTDTTKNDKTKNKITCLQYSKKKGLRILTRQIGTGLQTSTGVQIYRHQ